MLWVIVLAVVAVLGYFLYPSLFGTTHDPSNPVPLTANDDVEEQDEGPKEFTLEELKQYNGTDNKKIYLSLCGDVYDVTDAQFYKPREGPYNMFAGHDATICLAKYVKDAALLDKMDVVVESMPLAEQDMLNETIGLFQMKYQVVGWVKEWKEKHPEKDETEKKKD